jgi:hypothetical protein
MKQLDKICEHGINGSPNFAKWFRQYVIFLIVLFLS